MSMVVYKAGVWDLLHSGHLNVIRIAASLGDKLVIGVATDEYVLEYKGRLPTIPFHDRLRIIAELRSVDVVIPYHGPNDMVPINLHNVNVVVIDDFPSTGSPERISKAQDWLKELRIRGVQVVVIPRTPVVSSTYIKERIRDA